MRVGKILKELRGNDSQQQMAFEFNVSRESVSAYETERAKLPADISQKVMHKYDNPWFAMTLHHQYTRTGPVRLDGHRVDLHRSSVKGKVLEEISEAERWIKKVDLTNKLCHLSAWEKQDLHESLVQVADAITGLAQFMAVVCEEAQISYAGVWQAHYNKLVSNGYVKPESLTGGVNQ
jgi:transcriptional regulator with XRE-family HTH domain